MKQALRIGTRASPLALWQARWVAGVLEAACPGARHELVKIRTLAEKFPEREVPEIGIGIFTRELDDALLRGEIDIAVHSLKDVPSEVHPELRIAAVPLRESPFDAFVSADGTHLEDLPAGVRIGTGSPRRGAQLLHRRPDLEIVSLRGNVATRLRKIREQGLAGTVLAYAGLKRLGEERQATQILDPEILVPAVGQGALGVMARADRTEVLGILTVLDHVASHTAVLAERAFLRKLRGGCQVPAGALAVLGEWSSLKIVGVVAASDGSSLVRGEISGTANDAEGLGTRLAEDILRRGGEAILASERRI